MATQKLVSQIAPPEGAATPASFRAAPGFDTSQYDDTIEGSIDTVRQEIDDAYADMKTFHNLEPDECMRLSGGHSARLSEIRVRIQRVEDYKREWKAVRTREIEPTLEELERQWRNASRLHSVRELDYRMESGER